MVLVFKMASKSKMATILLKKIGTSRLNNYLRGVILYSGLLNSKSVSRINTNALHPYIVSFIKKFMVHLRDGIHKKVGEDLLFMCLGWRCLFTFES